MCRREKLNPLCFQQAATISSFSHPPFRSSLFTPRCNSRSFLTTRRTRGDRIVVKRVRRAVPCASTTEQVSYETQQPPSLQRYFETFTWRGYSINYRVEGSETCDHPVLIVHGFGASINHWRKNIPSMVETGQLRVYAIDLLGFGGSDKASPKQVEYGLPLWKELVCDFMEAMNAKEQWSLIGNSIGSLVCLMAAKELGPDRIRACALMNCAGGLVSFRYSELNPLQSGLLWLFNRILFNPIVGPYLFENFRKRSTIANILKQVYIEEKAITGDLLDILCEPAMDDGACDVFLAILNADPGPSPEELLPDLTWCPILVFWGDKDPWTPLDKGFHPGIDFPKYHPGLDLEVIPNAGHCIHDECPEAVNKLLVPFLLEPAFEEERGL
ncbi:Alpha/beta hydrolase [Gracilaria domingensis]|nr:Alpha/beta hydrolase [Gracilaria domingensis]